MTKPKVANANIFGTYFGGERSLAQDDGFTTPYRDAKSGICGQNGWYRHWYTIQVLSLNYYHKCVTEGLVISSASPPSLRGILIPGSTENLVELSHGYALTLGPSWGCVYKYWDI